MKNGSKKVPFNQEISETPKKKVENLLSSMPEDSTMKEIQYNIFGSEKLKMIHELSTWLTCYIMFFILIILSVLLLRKEIVFVTPFVFGFGVIGSCLSIQQRIKSISIDELRLYTYSFFTLFIFPLTGGILALLLYIGFLSEIIQGNFFPNFDFPHLFSGETKSEKLTKIFRSTMPSSGPDFSKLLFWSFIAGFSERFVIGLVDKNSTKQDITNGKTRNGSVD